MKTIKFTLSGKQAMFKKPDVNSYYYFTYGHIHKPALLGIFGAILGYAGYNGMKASDPFPAYYEILKDIKVSIVPNTGKGYFCKKMVYFNNSVGYASQEQGGNLIVKEQWLENPSWDIYVSLDCGEAEKLAACLLGSKCVFIPYLGKNDHVADITRVSAEEAEAVENGRKIDCLFPLKLADVDVEDWEMDNPFKYEESLPMSLAPVTNQYCLEKFVFTNLPAIASCGVWKVGGKDIVFY